MKHVIHRTFGLGVDALLVGALHAVHLRHGRLASSRTDFENYLDSCDRLTREDYFAFPAEMNEVRLDASDSISWESPVASEFVRNSRARALLFRVRNDAPTVIMLHALM